MDLQAEINQLKKELEEKNKDLEIAAHIGKKLLENNSYLNLCLDSLPKDYLKRIEDLEQEKYNLQLKLDAKCETEKTQASEIESLKESFETLTTKCEQLFKKEHKQVKKIQDLMEQNELLEKNYFEIYQQEDGFKQKVTLLEEQLKETQEQMQQTLSNETVGEELHNLRAELHKLLIDKQSLEQVVASTAGDLESAKKREQTLLMMYETAKQDVVEKNQEIASYFAALQKSSEELAEKQAEIEFTKLQQTDVNRRGNSLFAEVEDKRKSLERELISLRVKNQSTEEKYLINLKQLQKMKHQMATLLSMTSHKSDAAYVQKVEQSLSQARAEIQELTERLQQTEKRLEAFKKQQGSHVTSVQMGTVQLSSCQSSVENTNGKYNYLRTMLEQSQQEVSKLEKELQLSRMLKVAESDKLLQCQKSLYQAERQTEGLKSEVMRLKLRLEEVMNDKGESLKTAKKFVTKTEKIPGYQKILEKKNTVEDSVKLQENSTVLKESNFSVKQEEKLISMKKVSVDDTVTIMDENGQKETKKLSEEKLGAPLIRGGKKAVAPKVQVSGEGDINNCKQQ
ncbi:protein Spindly-B-like isoform X2 [Tachypleus tridentatus]